MRSKIAFLLLLVMAAAGWWGIQRARTRNSFFLEVSPVKVNFGKVPISETKTITIMVANRSEERTFVTTSPLEEPFVAPVGGFVLRPGEEKEVSVTFAPNSEGKMVGRFHLEEKHGVVGATVYLKGFGVLAKSAVADNAIPQNDSDRDLVLPASIPSQPSELRIAGLEGETREDFDDLARNQEIDRAGEEQGEREEENLSEWSLMAVMAMDDLGMDSSGTTGTGGEEPDRENPQRTTRPVISEERRAILEQEHRDLFGMMVSQQVAFSDVLKSEVSEEEAEEFHQLPDRQTKPDLPEPAREEEPEEEKGIPEEPEEEDTLPQPSLIIAGNSSVNLLGSDGGFPLQELRVGWSNDLANFTLEDRITYPRVWFAFGQYVDLEHWGEARGTFDPTTGDLSIPVTVRMTSSKGDVLDIPVELTTDWAFGFNESGEGVALKGRPRDSFTGDFKLVGIRNAPREPQTTFERKPLVFEVLGRISLPAD